MRERRNSNGAAGTPAIDRATAAYMRMLATMIRHTPDIEDPGVQEQILALSRRVHAEQGLAAVEEDIRKSLNNYVEAVREHRESGGDDDALMRALRERCGIREDEW